jgi:hypothetical protein
MNKIRKPVKGWLRVVLIIIPFILFAGISQMVGVMVLGLKPAERHLTLDTFQTTVLELFLLLGTFAVVGIFRRWIDRESFRSLGFGLKYLKQESLIGVLLGFVMISAGFVLLLLLHEISWVGTNPDAVKLLISLVLFVAVGFTEELLFRGYILNNLMLSMNRYVALLVSSVLFSLVHLGNANFDWFSFLSILLAGLLLGLPYIYTKSLWLPVALHFSWNFFQGTIFGFNVSGNQEYSLITQSRAADTLLNGGKFGFEGSVLAAVFLSLAIVALAIYYRRKEKLSPLALQSVNQEIPEQLSIPSAD